jgi:hypothetical protein
VKEVFVSLGIDPSTKMIIYSDSLNIDKALRLREQANDLGLNGTLSLRCLTGLLHKRQFPLESGRF